MSRLRRIRAWPSGLTLALWLALFVVAAIISVDGVSADFALAEWRFFKPVTLPEGLAGDEFVELTLDREIFRYSVAGQADLRLVQEGGEEVAYQLVVAASRQERIAVPAELRDLGYLPGKYTSFVISLDGAGDRHNEIEIQTADKNFRRKTVVEASSDSQTWAVLQEGSEIFDFTVKEQDFTARNTRIGYPESTARYVRVGVINGAKKPLEVTGAAVSLSRDMPAKETAYSPESLSRSEDTDSGSSVLALDSGSQGIPTTRLSFRTAAVNFHRDVTIEVSNDRENWEWQGEAPVYSYDTPKFVGDRLEVNYPESRHRYYRVTVQNRDDPPLLLEDITLQGVERKVIFLAQPNKELALYYGNPDAISLSYDLERLVPYLVTDSLPVAGLGAHQANPAYTLPELPLTERYPWVVPVAVTLAALVVGLLLFGVVRQAKQVLPPPDASPGD